jgi:dipeptidyl aminopeptidase/acylaminoacyl peptidase
VVIGQVDPEREFVTGFSYGAYLLNRLVAGRSPHPFRAAVCWEGVADLRLLTGDSLRIRTRWRGSPDERPEEWAAVEQIGGVGPWTSA